jgi:hypothetical protein
MTMAGVILFIFSPSLLFAADENRDIGIEPDAVTISSFFSGVQMHITCNIPPESQAVLSIRGKSIEAELMRKSHQWELWMNKGQVDISNAPVLYIALSSEPELLFRGSGEFPWGYDALEKDAGFKGRLKPSEDYKIFNEFIRLKERDKLYHLYPGDLKIDRISPGQWEAEADFSLPSRIKPGLYWITLWIMKDHSIVERRESSFNVQLQGLPRLLNSLAMKHGLIYGFAAVAIAMIVGILTGLAFHSIRGGH